MCENVDNDYDDDYDDKDHEIYGDEDDGEPLVVMCRLFQQEESVISVLQELNSFQWVDINIILAINIIGTIITTVTIKITQAGSYPHPLFVTNNDRSSSCHHRHHALMVKLSCNF